VIVNLLQFAISATKLDGTKLKNYITTINKKLSHR